MKHHISIAAAGALLFSSLAGAQQFQFHQRIAGLTNELGKGASNTPQKIACGNKHCYALINGEVYSVGDNVHGQLGLGHNTNQSHWVSTGLSGVTDIAAGSQFGYAIQDGIVLSVGRNTEGQLALGDYSPRNEWTATGLTGASQVSAGGTHGYALKDGRVHSVGSNRYYGQLALGHTEGQFTWQATSLTNVTQVAAGLRHGYALRYGRVYSVGYNFHGQLGLGTHGNWTHVFSWTNTGLNNVSEIAAGADHGHAIREGRIYSVGRNTRGQLGLGTGSTLANTWTATPITGATSIFGGGANGHAIVDGALMITGFNSSGEHGIGDTGQSNAFRHSGLENVVTVGTGTFHTFALTTSELFSAGSNEKGQLGLDDQLDRQSWTSVEIP